MGSPQDLAGWLAHLDALQPHTMRLGLTRVAAMREALGLHPKCPLIIVGGTNGKGSVCALLEEIYHAAGYRVGCYTSPHLLHYRERIRINRLPLEDEPLCQAFATVAQGPHAAALSYFEFGTLAAVAAFMAAQVDLMILEVGLGGRLDAVNAFDADCAIITSVDLDHQAQLGATREAIGFEKAGIFRAQRPAICADSAPPLSLQTHAHAIGARWLPITKKQSDGGFGHRVYAQQWDAWCENQAFRALPTADAAWQTPTR